MNHRTRILVSIGVVLAGALAVTILLRSGDEAKIRSRYRELLKAASIDGAMTPLGAAARAAELAGYFSTNVTIQAGSPFPAIRNRTQLTAFLQQAYLRARTVRIDDQGHHLQVGGNHPGYVMTGALFIRADASGFRDEWLAEYRIHWVREDDWVIRNVERHETIQPAPSRTAPSHP